MDVPAAAHEAVNAWAGCPSFEELAYLERADVNLVSLRRTLPAWLASSLATWAGGAPETFEQVLPMDRYDLRPATHSLPEAARLWLTADIAALLGGFAHFAEAARLRVFFGAVRSDQCRTFHMDYVRYRLITTYAGPGTEWVPEHALCREALEHPADCPCDANLEIVRDAKAVRHASVGEVLVMKGASHPHGLGAVHRSPAIEGTGQCRVVLVASTVHGA